MQRIAIMFYIVFLSLVGCGQSNKPNTIAKQKILIDSTGKTIESRFRTPIGFSRVPAHNNSFGYYLRNIPLKAPGSYVKYYDGTEKPLDVYEAVVDKKISKRNLHQCADAVIRLRAEYFYSQKLYDKIAFSLTNGFVVEYTEWMQGNRVVVNGNNTYWKKMAMESNTISDFENYLEFIYSYAGTLSLSRSLHKTSINELQIGDVFIMGGSPGHAVIVVDLAVNNKGEKMCLLAQSYMPAQETQILKNFNEPEISPWYRLSNATLAISTPEWNFDSSQIKTW
jgi:hypothetical protein